MPSLIVHHLGSVQELNLEKKVIKVGRGAECNIKIASDPSISRLHCMIVKTSKGFTVCDGDGFFRLSNNGVFLNNRRIKTGETPVLKKDDIIGLSASSHIVFGGLKEKEKDEDATVT